MNEALTYIDDFFRGNPGPMEKQAFEKRLKEDPAFAEEVAFYVATINVLKDDASSERRERYRNIKSTAPPEESEEYTNVKPMRNSRKLSWIYAAAASVLILLTVGWFMFGDRATPQEMCDRYIEEKFTVLPGKTMGGVLDSFQLAIKLDEEHKSNEALQILLDVDSRNPNLNSDVTKNIGIVYLKLGQYDKALYYFKRLEQTEGLAINYGLFYQAITLLKRNQSGDSDLAKKLLDQVDKYNLGGSDDARKILRRF